jgi:hypothetical protein
MSQFVAPEACSDPPCIFLSDRIHTFLARVEALIVPIHSRGTAFSQDLHDLLVALRVGSD